MKLEDYVDGVSALCLQGHAGYAKVFAERLVAHEPLVGQLCRAAIATIGNDLPMMRSAVQAAMAIDAEHPEVLNATSVMLAMAGDGDGAMRVARVAAQARPSARSELELARILLARERFDEARGLLAKIVAEHDDADAHILLAELKKHEPGDAALDHMVRAFLRSPADARPMRALMQLYRDSSWPFGVVAFAGQVRKTSGSPGLVFVSDLLRMAALLYLKGGPLEGLATLEPTAFTSAAAASAAMPALARCTLAGLFIDHARLDEAAALLADIAPTLSTPLERAQHAFLEGRRAQVAGDLDGAGERYREALGHDPLHTEAASNLVETLIQAGTPEAFERVGTVMAQMPELRRRLNTTLTFYEAVWREIRGERDAALELVAFLFEAPLGPLEAGVRAMYARLTAR